MIIFNIRYGDDDDDCIQICIDNNETYRILKEKVCSKIGLNKDNIHIIKNDSKDDIVYWKIMDDNSIVDSMRSDPDSLVVYTFEEYNDLCEDTVSECESDME